MKVRVLLLGVIVLSFDVSLLWARNDAVAVLSSDMAPYQEALSGFQAEFNQKVDVIQLADGPPHIQGQPRVVVAFGGKAAHQKYSDSAILIYCMAPGTFLTLNDHEGQTVEISMMPEPEVLLSKVKEIQPGLKRLAVLWSSPAFEVYANNASHQGPRLGVDIQAERLTKPEDLPGRLRDLKDKVDALWLPPDPLLVNSANVVILTRFSWSNHVPLYSAVAGLTDQGAVASLSSSYRDIGRAAGRAAREALSGRSVPAEYYPSTITVTIDRQSAIKAGIVFPTSRSDDVQENMR